MSSIASSLNRIARRYGRSQKRVVKLKASKKRAPVSGSVGSAEISAKETGTP